MAVTLSGTLTTAQLPRVTPTNEGQTVQIKAVGSTDYDAATNLQADAGNGFQFLNNVIAVWAASNSIDAKSATVQLWTMLNDLLNQPEVAPTYYAQ